MLINAIEGIVENGKIRLEENVRLPENAKVYVIVADPAQTLSHKIASPRLANPKQAADFSKQIVEIPSHAGL